MKTEIVNFLLKKKDLIESINQIEKFNFFYTCDNGHGEEMAFCKKNDVVANTHIRALRYFTKVEFAKFLRNEVKEITLFQSMDNGVMLVVNYSIDDSESYWISIRENDGENDNDDF